MARHIILEVRGLTSPTGLNPNQRELNRISAETGRPISVLDESRQRDSTTPISPATVAGSSFQTIKNYNAMRQEIAYSKSFITHQTRDSQFFTALDNLPKPPWEHLLPEGSMSLGKRLATEAAELAEAEKEKLKLLEARKPKLKQEAKAAKGTLVRQGTAVASAGLHYAKQGYDIYAQHQTNTYSMAGLTTANIKLKRQQQQAGLINKGVGIGVAFAINPILGAVQTAMTLAQQAFEYSEKLRRYQHEQQKENYSSNYYRNRLVRSNKVLI